MRAPPRCSVARGQSGHVCAATTGAGSPVNSSDGTGANAGGWREVAAEHKACTCATAKVEVRAELHVNKFATQAEVHRQDGSRTATRRLRAPPRYQRRLDPPALLPWTRHQGNVPLHARVDKVATLARRLLQPTARHPPKTLYRLLDGGQRLYTSCRKPMSHRKTRDLLPETERPQKQSSAASHSTATLVGDEALASCMRAPPRFHRLTCSGNSKHLREGSGSKATC